MKTLCTKAVNANEASAQIITTGPINDMFFNFKSEAENVFVTYIHNDEMPQKKFTFFFIHHQGREEIDLTESLDINFKFFKTINIEDGGKLIFVFIKEEDI